MLTAAAILLASLDLKTPRTTWVAGQREVLMGISPYKLTVLGYYTFQKRALEGESPDEVRVGHITYRAYEENVDDKPCLIIDTDGRRVQHLGEIRALDPFNPTAMQDIFLDGRKGRKCWVDMNGRMLKQQAFEVAVDGRYESEAVFNADDSITLTLRKDDKTRSVAMFPEGGNSAFNHEFVPMVKDGKVVMKEKAFQILTARGHIEKWKARYSGRFTGKILFIKYAGHVLDLESQGKTMKSYITYEGELLKVEFPDKSAAMVELVPHPWQIGTKEEQEMLRRVEGGKPGTLKGIKTESGG